MFRNSKGDLTAYALHCGYVERDEATGVSLALWGSDYKVLYGNGDWDSYPTLVEARKAWRGAIKSRRNETCLH